MRKARSQLKTVRRFRRMNPEKKPGLCYNLKWDPKGKHAGELKAHVSPSSGNVVALCPTCYAAQRDFDTNFLPHVEYVRAEPTETIIRRPTRSAKARQMASLRLPVKSMHGIIKSKSADGRTKAVTTGCDGTDTSLEDSAISEILAE
jgi:hypothetical protein